MHSEVLRRAQEALSGQTNTNTCTESLEVSEGAQSVSKLIVCFQ
jgi:hypothetical protein